MKTSSCVGTLVAVHLLTTSAVSLQADPFTNWVQGLPDIGYLEDIAFGNNTFVAVGSSGRIYFSKDGADWTLHQINYDYGFYGVTYGGGQFLALGTYTIHLGALTYIGMSTDGQSWQFRDDIWHEGEILRSVAYQNGAAVAISFYYNRLWYGTNFQGYGPYWTQVGTGSFANVAFGSDRFVVVGGGGLIQTSFNGKDWLVSNSGVPNTLVDVAYGNGTYVAVGLQGTILRSIDATNWIPCESTTSNRLLSIAFGAGVFLAAGDPASEVFSSTDGEVWQLHHTDIANGGSRSFGVGTLTFGAGRFVGIIGRTSIYRSGSVQIELSGCYRADLNGFEVTAQGGLERPYTLQGSTNLADWTDLLVFTNSGPTNIFLDTCASKTPHRFFRAVAP